MGRSSQTQLPTDEFLSAFTQFEPVPPEGIARAVEIMQTGRMFRYADEKPEECEAALFERDFAKYLGVKHALGVNSCSNAILLALIACGVKPGTKVLVPGFTFTAVPSAIVILDATPVLVECNRDYRMDIDDFRHKITPETKILLLSYMRGHVPEMDAILDLCKQHKIVVIEDAAHALGCEWGDRMIGTFGTVACFSGQSNKIINAGEGGIFATDDDEIFAKAVYLSGAYESLHLRHFNGNNEFFERYRNILPAHAVRMTNTTAAILRPQLKLIAHKGKYYRTMYVYLRDRLTASNRIEFPRKNVRERRIPDSIQFRIPGFSPEQMHAFITRVKEAGLPLSAFGEKNNARAFWNWKYIGNVADLHETREAIETACDMRLPVTLTTDHLDYIVETVLSAASEVAGS